MSRKTEITVRRLLRINDVIAMTGKSRSSIYADTLFPKPIKTGSRTSAWLHEELEEWIEARKLERDRPAN